jgi:hypothetical protein
MKSVFLVTIFFVSLASASGWMDLNVLPNSMLTRTGQNEYIAILRETHSVYPTEAYQCTLRLQINQRKAAQLGRFVSQGSWQRIVLTSELNLKDGAITYDSRFEEDRTSACLVWGEPYYDHGHWQRDCIEHTEKLETRVSTLAMTDSRRQVSARLECEKLRSKTELADLDQFYRAIYRSKSSLPFEFRAELD